MNTDSNQSDSPEQAMARWRLILGRFAEEGLPGALDAQGQRMDQALDFLYGREYHGRGGRSEGKTGGSGPSQLTIPAWLHEVRELFPRETAEVVERHALERYGMTELVTDPAIMERMEPNMALLRAVLTYKSLMSSAVLETARRLVRRVVEDLRRRLEGEVRRVLWGRLNRFQHSPLRVAQNFDWRRTLRTNLRHYDRQRGRLLAERIHFFARVERRLPWHVILAVDQSGSMLDSVIHSAVMAGILAGLPSLKVSLVVFDSSVVDLSGYVDDPTEALLSVQLGGGTDIARALAYCETLIENPHRTIVLLVSDFYEGGQPARLVAGVRRLREAGVRLLGLAALDPEANPSYDRQMAARLVAAGAEIAALTPLQLAEWLVRVIR
ncbi:MAG: VWA domain-containing protein [Roseiflexaceae bacterium]